MQPSTGTKAHTGCTQMGIDKHAEQHTGHIEVGSRGYRQTYKSSPAKAKAQAFNLKATFIQNYTKVALCQKKLYKELHHCLLWGSPDILCISYVAVAVIKTP